MESVYCAVSTESLHTRKTDTFSVYWVRMVLGTMRVPADSVSVLVRGCWSYIRFVGAFAKLRKANISFVMSVCLSD
jgi:hypothetical protein